MSQIKLKHSGGNSVIIAAPDSNPASDRTLKLPSDADGTILTTNSATGKTLQVIQTVKTDLFTTTTTNTYGDITGFNVTVTPASSTSKIFIMAQMYQHTSASTHVLYRLLRGSTEIGSSTVGSGGYTGIAGGSITTHRGSNVSFNLLDSPSTTSAITYKVQVLHGSGTYRLNSRSSTWNASSTLTVQEVAA